MTSRDTTSLPDPIASAPAALSIRRIAALTALALATAIPIVFIASLVDERQARESEVHGAIARTWGPSQTIWGPTLVMPLQPHDGEARYLKLAPDTLDIKTDIAPQQRRRGLFAATIYDATVSISGRFAVPSIAHPVEGSDEPMPTSGYLALPVSGIEGVQTDDAAVIGDTTAPWQLCRDTLPTATCDAPNILLADADLATTKNGTLGFSATLHLRGTQGLTIAAMAKQVVTTIKGPWRTPSFVGDALPFKSSVGEGGFAAEWRHDEIGKSRLTVSPLIFDFAAPHTKVGVDLIEATPVYRMITRAAKYSLFIVVLSFTTYLLFELLTGLRITMVQYALLGASLSLFTLLLLSVSEITGYGAGYTLSAAMVLGQASLYTASVARRARPTCIFAAVLASLFGFLYVLLGLESYALVIGTFALFVVLSIVMAVSHYVHGAPPVTAM